MFEISIKKEAGEFLSSLDRKTRDKIIRAIEQRLRAAPNLYGKPLRFSLKGSWGMRVWDYRVLYTIKGNRVDIYAVGHRGDIYRRFRN